MAKSQTLDPKQKQKYIIAGISFVVIAVAIFFLFIYHRKPAQLKKQQTGGEIKQIADLDLKNKPYVSLTPTADGAEVIISIENMTYFDSIEYEFTYDADNPQVPGTKIQRGSTGTDINPKDPKYKKDILLGTASKGVRSPDRGVTNGKLTLHLFKDQDQYLSESAWDMFEIGSKQTEVKSPDGNFNLTVAPTLGKTYWVIWADTVGVPPSYDHDIKKVITPVYGTFSVSPKFTKSAALKIKISTDATAPVLHAYDSQESKWQDPQTTFSDKTISTSVENFATFVVESSK